jgi:hypothetical protein
LTPLDKGGKKFVLKRGELKILSSKGGFFKNFFVVFLTPLVLKEKEKGERHLLTSFSGYPG